MNLINIPRLRVLGVGKLGNFLRSVGIANKNVNRLELNRLSLLYGHCANQMIIL